MSNITSIDLGPTQYKYVRQTNVIQQGKHTVMYRANVTPLKKNKHFLTLREAAIAVDKWLIMAGRKPVNILIPKP